MAEFSNKNLNPKGVKYFYRVTEIVTTFGKDDGKHEPFTHVTDFDKGSSKQCKEDATKYYTERFSGFEKGQYFLPYAGPADFVLGENSALVLLFR